MQQETAACNDLLDEQLRYCETALGPQHPLAAKMLAVMARLQFKLGDEDACEHLQHRVLVMRQVGDAG